jgi:DNA-binding NarL/FixJ family response regulator
MDDDPVMREVLAAYFNAHGGFRITGIAADGFEGAMIACDVTPDVVVIDYNMPRWDGERVASFIRERYPGTRIVVFSAFVDDKPQWADEYLSKANIDDLVPLVESLT